MKLFLFTAILFCLNIKGNQKDSSLNNDPLLIQQKSNSKLSAFSSSNLPLFFIVTHGQEISSEPKITADLGVVYKGLEVRNNYSDPKNHFNGKIGIETRGSSSDMFPKKSYGFELRTPAGDDSSFSLLGLPAESDWILNGPYSDKTFIRDALTYYLGRSLGHYAPRTMFIELFINNDYKGIYVLMERIKRDKNRVDIARLTPQDTIGEVLTGGYIFKVDRGNYDNIDGWYSNYYPAGLEKNKTYFVYVYPKPEDIAPGQKAYLETFTNDFEEALAGNAFTDPVNGYRKYIDVESFIDFFLINEISRNIDAYRLSTFLYKERSTRGGKLFAGPLWDFNLAFGNADYCNGQSSEGWSYLFNGVCPDDYYFVPFWWDKLLQDPYFANELNCRWNELRSSKFSSNYIDNYIDSVAQLLDEAQQRNFEKWPILGQYVWPNPFIGQTYEEEIYYMKNWIDDRIYWLDNNMPGICIENISDQETNMISFGVFPNPVNSDSYFLISLRNAEAGQIEILDLTGMVIKKYDHLTLKPGDNRLYLNINNSFHYGVYLARYINSVGKVRTLKFVVQN